MTFSMLIAAVLSILLPSAAPVRAQEAQPVDRFESRGAEVLDRKTHLLWQRCSYGMTWRTDGCAGLPEFLSWDAAMQLGTEGWRLPTIDELASLIDRDKRSRGELPKIDTIAFPDMGRRNFNEFWSGTYHPCVSNERRGCGLVVAFNDRIPDDVWNRARSDDVVRPVRLVRPATDASAGSDRTVADFVSADGSFAVHGDTALDRRTGLIWQRCTMGETYQAGLGCTGVVVRFVWADAMRRAPPGWRLPTIDELKSLMDARRRQAGLAPYLDVGVFPDADQGFSTYLTSKPYGQRDVWCVDFNIGVPTNCSATQPAVVRLVQGGNGPH